MNHSINVEIAVKYGIKEALFINFLKEQIKKANKKNDCFWLTISQDQILELLPYFKNRYKLLRTITNLKNKNVIKTEKFSLCDMDSTFSYSFVQPELFFGKEVSNG